MNIKQSIFKKHWRGEMKLHYKIWLDDKGEQVFGDGIYRLLELVEKYGSINQAAQMEKMSYRQAWGMIKTIEKRLNLRLLERRIGGESGGGATLTPEGRRLVKEYGEVSAKVEQLLKPFSQRLSDVILKINSDKNLEERDLK
jgi:molybdate transport system regulatory protein